ncbi:hypothetical protein IC620_15500 [Hazenella sp. IB182357]|uniref:Uncharacterized protein n=2 Tax=Polycladospora coralii TaxID=2771432 RepID=A0A926N843_9BACL|nr:hypothetical protein [Polycladospora coralii]MBD1373751.1 hypothetical protein [Polycladospora coralii]
MSYTPDSRNLADIRKEIKTELLAKLKSTDGLKNIQTVVYGDRVNIGKTSSMPLLWVLPVPHQPDLRGGHTELHDFTFTFVTMAYSVNNPEDGKEQAEDLTAKVYDVL